MASGRPIEEPTTIQVDASQEALRVLRSMEEDIQKWDDIEQRKLNLLSMRLDIAREYRLLGS